MFLEGKACEPQGGFEILMALWPESLRGFYSEIPLEPELYGTCYILYVFTPLTGH